MRGDGAEFFVLGLSSGIQVDPDPAIRTRYAAAMGVPDLGYPDRRVASHMSALAVPHLMLAPELAREAERSGRCLHGFDNAEPCRGHWNEHGHRFAGERLADVICTHLEAGLH